MIWPFKKKLNALLSDLSDEERYRKMRIAEIAELSGKSIEDATQLADRWIIQTIQSQHGLEDGGMSEPEIGYIPHPIWDDEWLLARETFPTREEAIAHVEGKGGHFLVPPC